MPSDPPDKQPPGAPPPAGPSSQHAVVASAPAESGDPYLGTQVAGRYKVLRKLGEGGMGVVYLAEHVFIEKKVAIKILSEDFARKADLVARFMQEAKAASKIGHENIIDITDFGETQSGSVFFVMEYLDGSDLARVIREQGPMPPARARNVMNQICRALGAAHAKGIIHRDLKPENIYLVEREGRTDFVKILDFGIAKISSLDEGSARLTRTGMIFGTPEYMSPEQARGDKPDHRVDIYAAGCILYEMLTGDVPFHAETFMGVLTKHMFEEPQPPSQRAPQAGVTPELEQVVLTALAKDRDRRYQSMKDMAMALEQALGGDAAQAWGNEPSSVAVSVTARATRSHAAQPPSATAVPAAPAPSKAGLWAALGVAVLAAGGAGAFVALKRPAQPPAPPAPAAVAPAPAPPAPSPPPAPAPSRISISTTPAEAEIFNGAERLGITPAHLELEPNTPPFEVTLRKKGYKDGKVRVQPDKDREYVVDLQPARTPSSSRPPRERPTVGGRPAPAPQPAEPKPAGKLRDLKDPFAN